LPFGEDIPAAYSNRSGTVGFGIDSIRQKFTAKERDLETGLDYFGARYYGSTQGRFTSVDPYNIVREAQITAQSNPDEARSQLQRYLRLPQQWNRYAYVANNPLKYVDPSGEHIELTGETEEERLAAFERIRVLVGKEGAKHLSISVAYGRKDHKSTLFRPSGPQIQRYQQVGILPERDDSK